jgi:deazaflavin-dependent oxidoreductase (nitroreductase family)
MPKEHRSYEQANTFQRAMRGFAASGPGSWLFSRVLHRVDAPVYRLTRGRTTFGGIVSGLPLVLLTTKGARSGLARSVPVLGLPTPEGLAVIASNWGSTRHPSWYHNLRADPEGQVSVGGVTRSFRACVAEGEAREAVWQQGLKVYPGWSQYERRAGDRQIAIFILEGT